MGWRSHRNGYSLHFQKGKALLYAIPDKIYPKMWRLLFKDGSQSDLCNLSRIKDAGITHGLSIVNNDHKNGHVVGRPFVKSEVRL
jgi:hypothetical protein